MSYEVIARKYRPQTFEDVVGQGHVSETLRNAIASDRVAHAYLFVGPRGTGKTSTARIFAKALNCEKGPTATPCNTCDLCKEITGGNAMDVLEIDGASNNGVEQVRELREHVRFMPARCRFKIYVIDEVHMLSVAAFNALLKTLEEPPPHVKFIFATTEPSKVPATILSRCQRFDLKRISVREIASRLAFIAGQECIDIDPAALDAIARGADGGMRDAQSALDQLIAFRSGRIVEEDVLSVFGLVSQRNIVAMANAVLSADVPTVLRLISELNESGKDLFRVLIELLEFFRDVLVFSYTKKPESLPDLSESQREDVKTVEAQSDAAHLVRIVEILMDSESQIRHGLSRRTALEMALIRAARSASFSTLDDVVRQVAILRKELPPPGEAGDAAKKS